MRRLKRPSPNAGVPGRNSLSRRPDEPDGFDHAASASATLERPAVTRYQTTGAEMKKRFEQRESFETLFLSELTSAGQRLPV